MVDQFRYAGLFKRFLAQFIDSLIFSTFAYILFVGVDQNQVGGPKFFSWLGVVIVVQWAYSSLMDSSKARGTFGKMALGIAVTDQMGKQISLKQATIRYLGKYLWIFLFLLGFLIGLVGQAAEGRQDSRFLLVTLFLWIVSLLMLAAGYLMAAFVPEKQALHDRMARTYVIEDENPNRAITQKVAFQLVAIAIVGRLLFHVLPGSSLLATSNQLADPPRPAPTQSPQPTSSPVPSNGAAAATTISRCGVTEQLLAPNSQAYLDGDWQINFSAGLIAHQSLLRMRGEDGVMRTKFFDNQTNREQEVLQDIKLRSSATGIWLLGSNPIDAATKQRADTYSPDNLYIQRAPDGRLIAFNCDNNNNRSAATIVSLTNNN